MVVVKLSKKEKLDELVAKVTLQVGHKPTQQELLDACVELGGEHFDELLAKVMPSPLIDDAKVEWILHMREQLAGAPWRTPKRNDFANEDDADIYSL